MINQKDSGKCQITLCWPSCKTPEDVEFLMLRFNNLPFFQVELVSNLLHFSKWQPLNLYQMNSSCHQKILCKFCCIGGVFCLKTMIVETFVKWSCIQCIFFISLSEFWLRNFKIWLCHGLPMWTAKRNNGCIMDKRKC